MVILSDQLSATTGIKEATLTSAIAVDASSLPGPVVTRDSRIIAYAQNGFADVIPC